MEKINIILNFLKRGFGLFLLFLIIINQINAETFISEPLVRHSPDNFTEILTLDSVNPNYLNITPINFDILENNNSVLVSKLNLLTNLIIALYTLVFALIGFIIYREIKNN